MQTSCEALQGWKRQDKLCPSVEGERVTTLPVQPRNPWGSNNKPTSTQTPPKQRWGHSRRHIQGKFISLLGNGCSLVLKKLGWIMKDIYHTLKNSNIGKNLPSLIRSLKLQCICHYVIWKHMCNEWVGFSTISNHTRLLVIGFSQIQDRALQVIKHLKARNKNHSKCYLNTMKTETPISDNLTASIALWWGQ